MTALLAKACALALAKHPVVNASCKDGKSFSYNEDINIAVAVAMDGGLLTPVLQKADQVCCCWCSIELHLFWRLSYSSIG
jgi:pyruvate dehydrogenase E2 component (dihydrolipoamide acetyltransferase)